MTLARFPVREYNPPKRDVAIAADTLIPFGILVGLDRDGHAVPAADAAGMALLGSAAGVGLPGGGTDADNRGNPAGKKVVRVKAGIFRYLNSGTAPVTAAELGKTVFVEDERTVARRTKHGVKAGVTIALVGEVFVWLFVGGVAAMPSPQSLGYE